MRKYDNVEIGKFYKLTIDNVGKWNVGKLWEVI